MKRYDPCVRCLNMAEAAAIAEKLGWDGICALLPPESFESSGKSNARIDVSIGIEIEARKPSDVSKNIGRYRKTAEVIAVRSSGPEINRLVLEMPEADMLLGGWEGGINHVLAKIGKENNVAVCFELQPLMFSHGRQRTDMFQKMLEAARYLRKAKAPIAIGSGAQMPMDLRDCGELASFGRLLGFDDSQIKAAMSGDRILENRKKLSGKWIMPGVETE